MSTIIRVKNKRSYVSIDARLLEDAIARRIAAIRSTSLETQERPATNRGSPTHPVVVSEAERGELDTESAFRSSASIARRLTLNDRPSASSLPPDQRLENLISAGKLWPILKPQPLSNLLRLDDSMEEIVEPKNSLSLGTD